MKPTVILSCDTTPDYLFLLPIVAKSWQLQGWDVCANVESDNTIDCVNDRMNFGDVDWFKHEVDGLETSSVAQIKRLYDTCNLFQNTTVCIGDVDMFIGSDFIYKRFDLINVFGHDLTDFGHIPMCYVTATRDQWREMMDFKEEDNQGDNIRWEVWITRMIKKHGKENTWCWDQDILTGQLKEYGFDRINFIHRGTDPSNSNLPLGRCDRYNNMHIPKGQIHDVHLMRNPMSEENTAKIIEIATMLYPNEDWSWILEYRNEFVNSIV